MWQQVKREYKIEDSLYAEGTASHPENEKSQTRSNNVPNAPPPIQIFLTVNPTKYTAQGPEYPRNKQHSSLPRQPTILKFVIGSVEKKPADSYPAARARKCKLYTTKEIEESTGMTKTYRKFWNDRAEEIWGSQALKSFKAGDVQRAINTAWTLEKTKHVMKEAEEVQSEIGHSCPLYLVNKFRMSQRTICQDLGPIFSQYGPRARSIRYTYHGL